LITGVGEFDRVLGGGLVAGAATLVGGPPGIGKSTLLLQAAAGLARRHGPVLYVSAEESLAQVRQRAGRLRAVHEDLWVTAASDLDQIAQQLDQVQPVACIVDSVQTVSDPSISSAPGSLAQVRDSAQWLVHQARARSAAMVLVGHVTKEGTLAGPRVLEHVVDTVVSFDGDGHHALRMLRVGKHRHGPTGELGVLEMTGRGLIDVLDASALFLADRCIDVPGSAVVATIDGDRPLLVELQSLVVDSSLPAPRRSAQGVDSSRLSVLLAVLQQRAGVPCGSRDVYVSAAGGARVVEPGADLGLCLAVASSMAGITLPSDLVVCGEVGLAGELRRPVGIEQRLAEAERVGYRTALVPATVEPGRSSLGMLRAGSVTEALDQVLGSSERRGPVDLVRGSSA
jgi:DNA repair protein RadA/Sms